MRLRPLLLTLAVLIPVSAAVWWFSRPAPAAAADARVGQRVADPAALASAARVKITTSGKSVELARGEGDRWTVVGEPALPADASRLTRLTGDLVSPKIDRLVSARPEKIATYELDSAGLVYSDASGKPLFDLDLGKTLENGARILRYGDEPKAYAARLNVYLDAEATPWRDTALVAGVQASDVASLSIGFPGSPAPIMISRTKAEDPWTSPSTPAGHQVRGSTLTAQVGNLTSLRYTNVAPNLDPGVVAARIFPRELTLTTFSGRTVKVSFARAPEPPAAPKPEAKEGETAPTTPPPAPRPVYVEITDSKPDALLAAAAKTHAFEIADWVFTALPAKTEDLFEPVPTPTSPAAASTDMKTATPPPPAVPASAPASISVTTPPLTIPTDQTGSTSVPPAAPASDAQPAESK
jgi:hypothetical protein